MCGRDRCAVALRLGAALGVVLLGACEDPASAEPERSLPAVPAALAEPDAAARLLATGGDVRVRRAGEADWAPASAGDPIFPGDAVQTMAGARAVLHFDATGSESELAADTTVVMPAGQAHVTRLTHLSGHLVARVAPSESSSRLEVQLPPGLLVLAQTPRADGTASEEIEADIDVDEERTEVAMTRGRARLERAGGPPVEVAPERFATIAPDGTVLAEGWARSAVTLIEPAADATVRTRSSVTFRWSPAPSTTGSYVHVTGAAGLALDLEGGSGVATAQLASGDYAWTVEATRDGELVRAGETRALSVELDETPPALTVSSPSEGETLAGAQLTVAGTTERDARLEIDGVPAPVGADGTFRASRPVPRGLIHVVVRVRDDVGNSRVVSRTVVRP